MEQTSLERDHMHVKVIKVGQGSGEYDGY